MSLKPPYNPTDSTGTVPLGAVNVTDFGAVGNGTTDDTVAIQAAIDSLPQTANLPRGGTVYFPRPSVAYRITSALDLADTRNVTLLGAALNAANEPATLEASRINYTGTSATRMIDCRSTQGFSAQGLAFTHDAAWTGTMFDFQHSATGGDSQHNKIVNCALAGVAQNTCTLVDWGNAIFQRIDNCYLGRSAIAILGRSATGFYSNSITIRDCQFARCNEAIVNGGDSWLIEGCGFEGTGGNIQHAYLNNLNAGNIVGNIGFKDCWFGDSSSSIPDYWIDFGSCNVRNLTLDNCMFNQEKVLKLKGGDRSINIYGGLMGQSTTDAIDLGTAISRGIVILGADFSAAGSSGVDALAHRAGTAHRQKVILGNTWGANDGTRGFDEVSMVSGHIHEEQGTAPTVTSIHANAGSGAAVTFDTNSTDRAGRLTLTTGTGPGAGVSNLVVLTGQHSWEVSNPRVTLTPANQAAVALGGWWASAASVAAWNLGLNSTITPAASTAYQLNYHVD